MIGRAIPAGPPGGDATEETAVRRQRMPPAPLAGPSIRRNGRLRMEQLEEGFVDRYPSGPRDVEELLLDGVVDDDVRDALAALSVDNRNAVLLYDVDGLTYGEIAAILGVRHGTVGSRICRGHAQLRAALAHRATTADHAAVAEASVEPAA